MEGRMGVAGAASNMSQQSILLGDWQKANSFSFVGVGLAPNAGGILLSRVWGNTGCTTPWQGRLDCWSARMWGVVYRVCEVDKLEKKQREQVLKKLRRGSANSFGDKVSLGKIQSWQKYLWIRIETTRIVIFNWRILKGVRAHSERPKFSGK